MSPVIFIFGGPIGSGKTLVRKYVERMLGADAIPPVIDVKSFTPRRSLPKTRDKRALNNAIASLVRKKVSFFLEYQFDGFNCHLITKLKDAIRKGYRLVLFYVGLDDPDIAIQRILKARKKRFYANNARIIMSYDTTRREKFFMRVAKLCSDLYLIDNRGKCTELYCYATYSPKKSSWEPYMEWQHYTKEDRPWKENYIKSLISA